MQGEKGAKPGAIPILRVLKNVRENSRCVDPHTWVSAFVLVTERHQSGAVPIDHLNPSDEANASSK